MAISGDVVADAVLREFDGWPQKRKPLVRSDGVKEWVPLSGIVAQGSPPCKGRLMQITRLITLEQGKNLLLV